MIERGGEEGEGRRQEQAEVKGGGQAPGRNWTLTGWSAGGRSGMPGVAVKCVEIRRNSSGEAG